MAQIDEFEFPDDLWYDCREHLWLRPEVVQGRTVVTVGVDAGGQDALGEAVYVQLPASGRQVARHEAVGSLEAEKMVRPLLAPVSGVVHEANAAVAARPGLIGEQPYAQGWLFSIEARDWERERVELLHGGEAVSAWIRQELAAHGRP